MFKRVRHISFGRVMAKVMAVFWGMGAWTSVSFADPTLFLANPQMAANVRLNLAQDAKEEILVASYEIKMDRAGLTTLAMLRNQARQGKRAVLLLDAFGNELPNSMLSYLTSEGVEIYQYHKFNWKNPFEYFYRHHLKIFVVDGKHLVSGDRNSANEYFGLKNNSFISRDVYVSGNAAQDAKAHIEELIKSGEVKRYSKTNVAPYFYFARKQMLDDAEASALSRRLSKDKSWMDQVFESDAVEFYHDPVGKKGKAPGVDHKIIEAIEKAQKEITFENPYIVLPDPLKDALQRASQRGVKIRALTNSLESTNARPAAIAWEKSKQFLASIGAEIWEHPGNPMLNAPGSNDRQAVTKFQKMRAFLKGLGKSGLTLGMLHAKTMVVDGMHSYIMSFNFDPISQKRNMESVTHIQGKKFAQQLTGEIEKDLVEFGYRLVAAEGKVLSSGLSRTASCLSRLIPKFLERQL